jgi:hypothetical protein
MIMTASSWNILPADKQLAIMDLPVLLPTFSL